jgi:UDP-N-acetylmuramoylalanine--D-glutamate ligase
MNLKDKKVLVVGLGKTGLETALFLHKKGAHVRVSDMSPPDKLKNEIDLLGAKGIETESGGHTDVTFLWAELIVLSPGVPFNIPELKKAGRIGIEVISEVELASRFITKPVIAVTGSNGKTTTCTLISNILEKCGRKVFLGANIGTPLVTIAGRDSEYDVLVLELSSFQLQGVSRFKPDISIVLNISPNHLDHHESYGEYVESKMKIAMNQKSEDLFIYKSDDEEINKQLSQINATKIPFGTALSENGISYNECCVRYGKDLYELSGMKLRGRHNIDNIMAAIAGARALGCEPAQIRKAVIGFEPLPHRNEYLGEIRGAYFYNDSKSTSPGATLSALKSVKAPVILIAGGKDKGVSYATLKNIVNEKVKVLVLIGEARQRMSEELGGNVRSILADSLKGAVDSVLDNLEPRDSVLFSPACSSFDMFESYEHRGRRFKEIVENIRYG